jgi:hypothetical protein
MSPFRRGHYLQHLNLTFYVYIMNNGIPKRIVVLKFHDTTLYTLNILQCYMYRNKGSRIVNYLLEFIPSIFHILIYLFYLVK